MRVHAEPVVSSVNVPTIPLAVAQAMNPAPRPPSPTARAATQRAMRRENTNQLSTRDAEILMSLGHAALSTNEDDKVGNRLGLESFFSELETESPVSSTTSPKLQAPPVRPPREMRRKPSTSEVRFFHSSIPHHLHLCHTNSTRPWNPTSSNGQIITCRARCRSPRKAPFAAVWNCSASPSRSRVREPRRCLTARSHVARGTTTWKGCSPCSTFCLTTTSRWARSASTTYARAGVTRSYSCSRRFARGTRSGSQFCSRSGRLRCRQVHLSHNDRVMVVMTIELAIANRLDLSFFLFLFLSIGRAGLVEKFESLIDW